MIHDMTRILEKHTFEKYSDTQMIPLAVTLRLPPYHVPAEFFGFPYLSIYTFIFPGIVKWQLSIALSVMTPFSMYILHLLPFLAFVFTFFNPKLLKVHVTRVESLGGIAR